MRLIDCSHMKLINLTPHVINLHAQGQIIVLEPSGIIARLEIECMDLADMVVDGIIVQIKATILKNLVDMPEPQDGVCYVASAVVTKRAMELDREDVFGPGELIRDADGVVIGCNGLALYGSMA